MTVSTKINKWNRMMSLSEVSLVLLNLNKQILTGLVELQGVLTIGSNSLSFTRQSLKTCIVTFLPFRSGTEI